MDAAESIPIRNEEVKGEKLNLTKDELRDSIESKKSLTSNAKSYGSNFT